MKAVPYYKSSGLTFMDVPKPKLDDDMVLIRTVNTGVCGSDRHALLQGKVAEGYILGHEVSGIVEMVGSNVTGISTGQRAVFRHTYCGSCADCRNGRAHHCMVHRRGIGVRDMPGAFAEYFTVFPQMVIPLPLGVDSRNAALAEVLASSLHGLVMSRATGGSVLVLGAGPIGLALVALLKLHNFFPIIVSEPDLAKRKLADFFGAHYTIDPLHESLGSCVYANTDDQGVDTVFECSGVSKNVNLGMELVRYQGTICIVSIIYPMVSFCPRDYNYKEITLTASISNTHEEMRQCVQWMADKKINLQPIISHAISLQELPKIYLECIAPGKANKVLICVGDEF